jgi:hypothetical protein
LSGHQGKLKEDAKRKILTVFAYGTGLGPTQIAKNITDLSARQVAFVNQRQVTTEKLETAICTSINAYNRFLLPRYWGDTKRAAADGTQWNLYENNLLSERHIRYGGYGGIAYYHVSDDYIALFSHFIPCGVWEAVYILDGLTKNRSDIRPDTLHGDTQAQSAPVYALAYLLGIKLMPRIRNWKDLKWFRPSATGVYQHIDGLFTKDSVDWELIETHLPDMLQVAQSIQAGRISPSTILRKLGSASRKKRTNSTMHSGNWDVLSGPAFCWNTSATVNSGRSSRRRRTSARVSTSSHNGPISVPMLSRTTCATISSRSSSTIISSPT